MGEDAAEEDVFLSPLQSFSDYAQDDSPISPTRKCFGGIDATTFAVRGPTYLRDRVKNTNPAGALGELVAVDMFRSEENIPRICTCTAAGTIQRIRANGEKRKLFVLNFRALPLVVVAVIALPPLDRVSLSPAEALLLRVMDPSMDKGERNLRLKGIPRIRNAPAVLQLIFREVPWILGKYCSGVDYYFGDNEFEVSIPLLNTRFMRHVVGLILNLMKFFHAEVAYLIEGRTEEELPEQVLCGVPST